MSKILKMTLKKEWFNKIKSGEKTVEYRELKRYWTSRLGGDGTRDRDDDETGYDVDFFKEIFYDAVEFKNGYSKNAPTILVKWKGTRILRNIETPIGKGDFFAIYLGEVLEVKE